METRVTVNGIEYMSIEEMPPDVRAEYDRAMQMLADRDGNGVPDILEGKPGISFEAGLKPLSMGVTKTSNVVITRSTTTTSSDDPPQLPPQVRKRFEPRDPQQAAGRGGVTIRLGWSTLLAAIAAVIVTVLVILTLRH